MRYLLWVDPLSAVFTFMLGVLASQLVLWKRWGKLTSEKETVASRKSEIQKQELILVEQEKSLQNRTEEVDTQEHELEQQRASIQPEIDKINAWWEKAQKREKALAQEEEKIQRREAIAEVKVNKARAELKGARARARRLLEKYHAS